MIKKIQDIKKSVKLPPRLIDEKSINFFSDIEPKVKINPIIKKEEKKRKNTVYIFFSFCLIILFIYLSSTTFNKANILIKQKHQSIPVEKLGLNATKENDPKIPFEIMKIDFNNSVDITLQDSENISKKARGIVTFHNEYTKKPIKINKGTFISDPNGKTYTTDETINIPYLNSVQVPITAFLDGDSYNTDSTDFFVNDFKKDKLKYTKVYAKSERGINGGFSGKVYVVNEEDKKILEEKIKNEFKEELTKKMIAQVPNSYILYNDSIDFIYTIDEQSLHSKSPQAEIGINGSISSPIFKKKNLEDILLKKLLPNKKDDDYKQIEILGVENLTFSYDSSSQIISKETQSVNFNLNGNVEAIWHPNLDIIKNSLLDKTISESMSIFEKNEGIGSASVKIFPLWLKKIPLESKKVILKVE